MKSSFNAFGNGQKVVGGSTPVWLGTVTPVPRGGFLYPEMFVPGALYPAGTPVFYSAEDRIIAPLPVFDITEYQSGSPYDTIKVKTYGFDLKVGSSFRLVGSTFGEEKPSLTVEEVKQIPGGQEIKFAHTTMEGLYEGATVIYGDFDSEFCPNGYLYNDICISPDVDGSEEARMDGTSSATGAVVMYHAEGILIDRTPAAGIAEAMAKAVPGVLQVKG